MREIGVERGGDNVTLRDVLYIRRSVNRTKPLDKRHKGIAWVKDHHAISSRTTLCRYIL